MAGQAGKFQEEETPIDQAIVEALADLMPESWDAIRLVLKYLPFDPAGLAHSLQSPEGHADVIEPDASLYEATRALERLFERHGKKFKSARYEVAFDDEGDLDYKVDFEY